MRHGAPRHAVIYARRLRRFNASSLIFFSVSYFVFFATAFSYASMPLYRPFIDSHAASQISIAELHITLSPLMLSAYFGHFLFFFLQAFAID
jgi:hypothetical protein